MIQYWFDVQQKYPDKNPVIVGGFLTISKSRKLLIAMIAIFSIKWYTKYTGSSEPFCMKALNFVWKLCFFKSQEGEYKKDWKEFSNLLFLQKKSVKRHHSSLQLCGSLDKVANRGRRKAQSPFITTSVEWS